MFTDFTPFQFDNQPVRVIQRDGEPWFVAADLCRCVGLGPDATAALDPDETAIVAGDLVVSESGLHVLTLRSRKAVTPGTVQHRFRKWVATELLPAVRRAARPEATGGMSPTPLFVHRGGERPEDAAW